MLFLKSHINLFPDTNLFIFNYYRTSNPFLIVIHPENILCLINDFTTIKNMVNFYYF